MRLNHLKACLKTTVLLTAVLLLGAGRVVAQQQVNLTAAPTSVTLPDGTAVPITADTICLHGDSPGAEKVARSIREALKEAGIKTGPLKA